MSHYLYYVKTDPAGRVLWAGYGPDKIAEMREVGDCSNAIETVFSLLKENINDNSFVFFPSITTQFLKLYGRDAAHIDVWKEELDKNPYLNKATTERLVDMTKRYWHVHEGTKACNGNCGGVPCR